MDKLLLLVCIGLVVAGLAVVATAFKAVPREPPGLPPAQLVIDGKHDLGGPRSPRVRVQNNRLVGGILVIVVAVIAGLATVSYSLDHMTFGFTGSWLPGN
jgi:hypothetical protein